MNTKTTPTSITGFRRDKKAACSSVNLVRISMVGTSVTMAQNHTRAVTGAVCSCCVGWCLLPSAGCFLRLWSQGNQYFSNWWVFFFFNFKESLFCSVGYEISLTPVSIMFPSCSKSWGSLWLFLVHNLVLWFRHLSEEGPGPHLSYQEGRRTAPTTSKLDRSWVCS